MRLLPRVVHLDVVRLSGQTRRHVERRSCHQALPQHVEQIHGLDGLVCLHRQDDLTVRGQHGVRKVGATRCCDYPQTDCHCVEQVCRRVVRTQACHRVVRNRDHDHHRKACRRVVQKRGGHHEERKLACHRVVQNRDHDRRRMACRHVVHKQACRYDQHRDDHRAERKSDHCCDHCPSDHLCHLHRVRKNPLGVHVVSPVAQGRR